MMVQRKNPWHRRAFRTLQDLQERFGETVNLGVLEGDRIVYAEVLRSERSALAPILGSPVAVNATALGKAITAWLPEQDQSHLIERWRLVALTPRSIVTKRELLAEFAQIRSRGYALDAEEETPGYFCVAAPMFGRMGRPESAISITAPYSRMTPQLVRALAEAVIEACENVQRACGAVGTNAVSSLQFTGPRDPR
jgi:IclR family acetate operon transcriptional repressor